MHVSTLFESEHGPWLAGSQRKCILPVNLDWAPQSLPGSASQVQPLPPLPLLVP